jgi:hypothetical protein
VRSSLTTANILLICDVFEFDDVIYSVYRREREVDELLGEDLFGRAGIYDRHPLFECLFNFFYAAFMLFV